MEPVCYRCQWTYEAGNHEVGPDGRFSPGGHYFEDEPDEDEEES